jgi:hypothetical protein
VRFLSITLVLLMGCHTCPKHPPPSFYRRAQNENRPEDLSGRILAGDYPDWLKRNYAMWVRYAYDREVPTPGE